MKYEQQGDVLVYTESKLPKSATPLNGATVAFGEATGHNHTFYDDEACVAEKFDHRNGGGLMAGDWHFLGGVEVKTKRDIKYWRKEAREWKLAAESWRIRKQVLTLGEMSGCKKPRAKNFWA